MVTAHAGQAEDLRRLVELALAEDIGGGDVTGEATVPAEARAEARIVQKAPGVIFGLDAVEEAYRQLGARCGVRPAGDANPGGSSANEEGRTAVVVERECAEGEWRGAAPGCDAEAGAAPGGDVAGEGQLALPVARLSGPARELLAGERAALNFLAHLSGVATLTARFVAAVEGTGARVLDTRKTTPGMRLLEKAAVAAGGGDNHRAGLYDAYLIKENHIALAGGVAAAITACRRHAASGESAAAGRGAAMPIQVECETLAQLREAIEAGADRVLLDNMAPDDLAEAVALRNRQAGPPGPAPPDADAGLPSGAAPFPLLEASGGITLANVRAIAETGVDLISIGAITHSAPALDLSLLIDSR
ncbi:MAG TPA: carboxylating nicotinate-nucleotide diphosphorylase [Solirubrobacterales bacterium]|nr:carboxylating nicotinate-nucleotide diphosphorylase [Solirubrobacterales bacterium]